MNEIANELTIVWSVELHFLDNITMIKMIAWNGASAPHVI